MDREALPENPENSTPLPTDQGEPINPINLLASNTTLNQLLDANLQSDTPEPTEDEYVSPFLSDDWMEGLAKTGQSCGAHGLSEGEKRDFGVDFYVFMAWHRAESVGIQNSIKSGQYKEVADEKIGDFLESVNTLLEGIELTKGESEALKIFNFDVSQLTNRLNASINSNKEDLFRGLVESFGTLMNSLNDAMESTPNLTRDLKSLFRTGEDQLRNALEDIVTVAQLTINDVADIIYEFARSEKHKQSLQKLMPQIIEGLKEYMLSKDKDYGTKYL